jgi:hypothetical protein
MISRVVVAACVLALPGVMQKGLAQKPLAALSCPEKLLVTETVASVEGWKASGSQVEHPFERVSIFNGTPGGKEYELAPDLQNQMGRNVSQNWNLKDYRSMNIFLRCRYHDTAAVLFRDVPAGLQTCTFTFTSEKKGDFIGKSSLTCR